MHALSETITRLRKIVKTHQSTLMKNETVTRYALVDPMLQALGWDVTDPAVVIPEYQVSGYGKTKAYADYALFDTKPRKNPPEDPSAIPSVIVEAKKLGAPDKDMGEAEKSAQHTAGVANAKYYAITDGNNWLLYQFASSTTQQVMNFRLDELNAKIFALCEKILPLGRMYLGRDVFSDNPNPIVNPKRPATRAIKSHYPDSPSLIAPPRSSNPPTNWVPLTRAHQIFSNNSTSRRQRFIARFPDQTEKGPNSGWNGLSKAVIDWLDQRGDLNNLTTVPVTTGTARVFASTSNQTANGKKFSRSYLARVSGLYFEMNADGHSLMQGTITLLKMAGYDPNSISIKITFPDSPSLIVPPKPSNPPANWVSLTKAHQIFGNNSTKRRLRFAARFPDQTEKNTNSGWSGLSKVVIDWLDRRGDLRNLTTVPLTKGTTRVFANTSNQTANGKAFRRSHPARVSGLYFEMNADAHSLMQGTITLLKMAGHDPDNILIGLTHK